MSVFSYFMALVVLSLSCMALHQHLPENQVEQQNLQQMQMKLANELTNMQDQLSDLDQRLAATSSTATKLDILDKAIPQQRQGMENIAGYVQPSNLKLCQCPKISAQQRQSIEDKLQSMSRSVSQLEGQLENCRSTSCSKYDEIQLQLTQFKSSLESTQKLLSSDCCKKINNFKE